MTYIGHNLGKLLISRTKLNPCVIVRRGENGPDFIVALCVDYNLEIVASIFLEEEETSSKPFKKKLSKVLGMDETSFNGIYIRRLQDSTINISQTDKISKLVVSTTKNVFFSQRAMTLYIDVNNRPYICTKEQLFAPGKEDIKPSELKSLKKVINNLQKMKDVRVSYTLLDLPVVLIVIFTDASFENFKGMKIQL